MLSIEIMRTKDAYKWWWRVKLYTVTVESAKSPCYVYNTACEEAFAALQGIEAQIKAGVNICPK